MRSFDVPMIRATGKGGGKKYRMLMPISVDMPSTVSPLSKSSGSKMKYAIKVIGLTQEKAAEQTNVGKGTISKWVQQGKVGIDQMAMLGHGLKIDPRTFLTDKNYDAMDDDEKRSAYEAEEFGLKVGDRLSELPQEEREKIMRIIADLLDMDRKNDS